MLNQYLQANNLSFQQGINNTEIVTTNIVITLIVSINQI